MHQDEESADCQGKRPKVLWKSDLGSCVGGGDDAPEYKTARNTTPRPSHVDPVFKRCPRLIPVPINPTMLFLISAALLHRPMCVQISHAP